MYFAYSNGLLSQYCHHEGGGVDTLRTSSKWRTDPVREGSKFFGSFVHAARARSTVSSARCSCPGVVRYSCCMLAHLSAKESGTVDSERLLSEGVECVLDIRQSLCSGRVLKG